MSYVACSRCHKVQREKPAAVYWAWFDEDVRSAWKERYCDYCVDSSLRPLAERQILREHDRGPACCDNCKSEVSYEDEMRLFGMCFLRGNEPVQLRLVFCDDCGTVARDAIRDLGERLPDRDSVLNGASARHAPRGIAPLVE